MHIRTIWIINQYASHLVTRHEELSKHFAEHGYRVGVITSSFHHGSREYLYSDRITYQELCAGVTYVYLHSGPSYKQNGVGRIINMLDFCWMINKHMRDISQVIGDPDIVIASSAPPFVWEIGYKVAKRYKAKFIAEFRDIWPLSLIEIQGLSKRHPLVRLLSIIEKRAYRNADAIVSTMKDAWKHVVDVGKVSRNKVFWMPNGIDTAEVDKSLASREKLPSTLDNYLSSHWCCIYVGSIVKSECLDYLVSILGKLEKSGIYFAIIGEGHEKENIQRMIDDNNYTNVKMFSFLDRNLIPKALQKAGCCVCACKDVGIGRYGLSMYKLSDYLYSGKPTVFAYDLCSVVDDAGQFSIPYGDDSSFAETIKGIKRIDTDELQKMALKSKQTIYDEYDFKRISSNYIDVIESC